MNVNEVIGKINDVDIAQTESVISVNNAIDAREDKMKSIAEAFDGSDMAVFAASSIVQEGVDTSKLHVLHNHNEKVRGKIDLKIEELTKTWDAHNAKIKELREKQNKLNDEIIKIAKSADDGNVSELRQKLDAQRKEYDAVTKEIAEEQKTMLTIDKQIRNDYDKLYSRLVKFPTGSATKNTEKKSDEKWRPGLNKAYENETRTKKELEESGEDKSEKDEKKKK